MYSTYIYKLSSLQLSNKHYEKIDVARYIVIVHLPRDVNLTTRSHEHAKSCDPYERMLYFDNHTSVDGITEDNFIESKASIEPYLREDNECIINRLLLPYVKGAVPWSIIRLKTLKNQAFPRYQTGQEEVEFSSSSMEFISKTAFVPIYDYCAT